MPPTVRKQTPIPSKNSAKKSVLDRIAPIGFDGDEGIKALFYGRSGTGKTTLWATFPKPILAMICSGGNRPGELRSINTPEYRETIKQVSLHSAEEMKELVEYQQEEGIFKTLILDHATGFQDQVLKELLGLDEIPVQKGWGLASQQQYGQLTQQVKEYLRALLSLDCNVVIIAQEREFNTDSESDLISPFVGAGLTPSLTGWLNTAVDYICQTYIRQKEEVKKTTLHQGKKSITKEIRTKVKGQVEFCLRTAPDPVYTTKFRIPKGQSGNFPNEIVDPSYEKIAQLIKGDE